MYGCFIALFRARSDSLDFKIAENQIVQSHTIYRPLAKLFGDKPVLILGGQEDRCRRVAEQQVLFPSGLITEVSPNV